MITCLIGFVQALLAGCNANATDHFGFQPVHYAAQLAPPNMLCRLVCSSVDLNALTTGANKCNSELGQCGRGDMSPLMLAASRGRADTIQMLLRCGARPALTNSRRETALHFAAAAPVCTEECIIALVGQLVGSPRALANLLNMQVF